MCDKLRDLFQSCSERVPARVVLGIMAFLCFLVTQMIRANLYIAIVGMISTKAVNISDAELSNFTNQTNEDMLMDSQKNLSFKTDNFYWDEATQGILLGAFYWCYWLTELPGGIMAQRWGGRKVLGFGVGIAGILNAFVPMASRMHAGMLAGVRAVQGLALGVTWPAMHALAGRWIPAAERSKFMSTYHGAAIGNALTYPICGLMMERFSWESTFYMTAAVNILWALGCWIFVFDGPEKHPRIVTYEKKYINRELHNNRNTAHIQPRSTPWLQMCTSGACWAVLVASQGVMWCSITLSMQLPTYFKNVLSFDLKTNGILSGVPELCKFGFGLCFSALMDWLLHRKVMSLTSIRKISVATCEYIPAALLLILSFTDASSDTTYAVVLLILASAFGGATSSGSLANIVDISPNYAGIILGFIKTLSMIPGVLSPLVAGLLTSQTNVIVGWQMVFTITAVIHIVCCTLYLIFGTAEIQWWNDGAKPSECLPLKPPKPENIVKDNDEVEANN